MKKFECFLSLLFILGCVCCQSNRKTENENKDSAGFPKELVEFTPYQSTPVFTSTGVETWDKKMRERGFILFDAGIFKMWYTGYNGSEDEPKYLGYATSEDGRHWERYADTPIFKDKWTEDVFVLKESGKYYMFAEGRNDIAHQLMSDDGIHWQEQGDLEIRKKSGGAKIPGPYGTPTVWVENGKWYLFYEVNDEAVWLATSTDHKTWVNVQDAPVLEKGPGRYDGGAIAADQVIKYNGRYYLLYHASVTNWKSSDAWSSNIASSKDLIHWDKYEKNPIVQGDHSSPIFVLNNHKYWLYTMHPGVYLYLPK